MNTNFLNITYKSHLCFDFFYRKKDHDGHLFEKTFEKRPVQQLVLFGLGPWDDGNILQAELVSDQGVTSLGLVSSKCR